MRFLTLPPTMQKETVLLKITANTQNYNIYTQAGSPSARVVHVLLIISPGVVVGSSSVATASLQTGVGFKNGSTIKIVNKGNIIGAGGAGGDAAVMAATGAALTCVNPDAAPSNGGHAMLLNYSVKIDNTNGNIFGGGGGGVAGTSYVDSFTNTVQAGGGGGGAGSTGGAGSSTGGTTAPQFPGGNGAAGSTIGGTGGVGGTDTVVSGQAQDGGAGGAYGENGLGSVQNVGIGCATNAWTGSGGKAISLGGFTVSWLGGNNSSQVKGAVS